MWPFDRREPVELKQQHPVAEPSADELGDYTVINRDYVIAMLDDLLVAARRADCKPLVDLIIDERCEIRPPYALSVPVVPGRSL
jgi:hypothetical protein